MADDWQGKRQAKRPKEMRLPVAIYEAVVRLDVESSKFSIATGIDRSILETALLTRPEWCPVEWPIVESPTQDDLRRAALLKLGIFFDFAAKLPSGSGQEIRTALMQRFPKLRGVKAEGRGRRYKRFLIQATIWSDGECDGGYDHPSKGEHPPVGKVTYDTLDLLIKNLVRADLRDKLDAAGGTWPPPADPNSSRAP